MRSFRAAQFALLFLVSVLTGPTAADWSVGNGSGASGVSNPVGQPGPEWTYTPKIGESLAEISEQLLLPDVSLRRLANLNGLVSPDALVPGKPVRIPVAWLKDQPEPARATRVTGDVRLRSATSGRTTPLTRNAVIRVGDTLISGRGTASVKLADGSTLQLQAQSEITFNRLSHYGKSGMVDSQLRLRRGGVDAHVQPLMEGGSRFEIRTPSAVAAVRGTEFSLTADSSGSHIRVTEGKVMFGAEGRTQMIPAGYGARIGNNGAGSPTTFKLPPAPSLSAVPERVEALPLDLTWSNMSAPAYRLDVSDAATGARIISETMTKPGFELSGLPNGNYSVQVAALTREGTPGLTAEETFKLALRARAARPQSPLDGAKVANMEPQFQWQFIGNSEKAKVEVSERDDFSRITASSAWTTAQVATLDKSLSPGNYHWRVVTQAGGDSEAVSAVQRLTIDGVLPPARILSVNYLKDQVRIFWEEIDSVHTYQVQLSEDPAFTSVSKEAELKGTTAALKLVPGKRYYVRVKGLSDGPLASQWGPGKALYVD